MRSLKEAVSGPEPHHLLLQTDDRPRALDVARRAHQASARAARPFVQYDALVLSTGQTARDMLEAFKDGPLSPLRQVGDGTLAVYNLDRLPEEFQQVFSNVIKAGAPAPRPAASNLPYLEARVIMIESGEEKTHSSLRQVAAFIPLERYADDL